MLVYNIIAVRIMIFKGCVHIQDYHTKLFLLFKKLKRRTYFMHLNAGAAKTNFGADQNPQFES